MFSISQSTMLSFIIFSMISFSHLFSNDGINQYNTLELNEKYWVYKKRLIEKFSRPGLGNGRSIIAAHRREEPQVELKFADNTSMSGWYIGALATEWAVLNQYKKSTKATEKELFFALKAIERLDQRAEELYLATGKINGFFIRDDVEENMKELFDVENLVSDWISERNGAYQLNAMSQDQAIHLFMGFALLKGLLPDEVSYQGVSLRKLTQKITQRIFDVLHSDRWTIINPVTNEEVPRGPNTKTMSIGLKKTAEFILDKKLPGAHYSSFLLFDYARTGGVPRFFNRVMVLILTSVSDLYNNRASQRIFARYHKLYGDLNIYPYIHHVLFGSTIKGKSSSAQSSFDLLKSAPMEAPRFENQQTWSTWNRYLQPYSDKTPNLNERRYPFNAGQSFAGLDYIIMHNLFMLTYKPSNFSMNGHAEYEAMLHQRSN